MRVEPRHLREISEVLGHKWDLVILTHLSNGSLRYMELVHAIRVTDRDLTEGVLSKNLKRLAANGMVHQHATANAHRAYALTSRARRIVAVLAQVTDLTHDPPDSAQPALPDTAPPPPSDRPEPTPGP